MAVIPINLARVSQNLRAFNLLESVRRNTTGLFRVQNQLATGLKVMVPSDDPMRAATAGVLDRRLELISQLERNLLHVNNALTQGESAVQDAVNLLMEVQTIASQTVGDTSSPDERSSLARVVESVLDQLVAVGNRRYLDTPLFAGLFGGGDPFDLTDGGLLYRGDNGRAFATVATDLTQDFYTFSGAEVFNAVSTGVRGFVDLDPALTRETRICDLRGTAGTGVHLDRIAVSNGSEEVQIDLSGCDTVGDLLDKLNAELPAGLQADLGVSGLTIGPGLGAPVPLTIRDLYGGSSARDLGLLADGLLGTAGGADLDPALTLRSPLSSLLGGAGLDVTDGLTVTNGAQSATLDLSEAETLEDVLNRFNGAGVNVWARIADDGRTIEIRNRLSGSDLTIAENGGTLATALGVRSMHASTTLGGLNDGRGIQTVDGADLRIVTADGNSFEVDLDGAETLQDVIDLINAAGGGAVTAGLAASGNGLALMDNTGGAGTFSVEKANLSPALDSLGLNVAAVGDTLIGRDVNPVRGDNAFTALLELSDALRHDDRTGIDWAGARLERALERMQEVQGRLAAHARAMESRNRLVETETTGALTLLSDVRDVDMAEAIVRFQQMQTALQANLSTASRVLNLSLLDFLR